MCPGLLSNQVIPLLTSSPDILDMQDQPTLETGRQIIQNLNLY